MTTSTNGQICYGIALDEDTEFPWDSDEYEGDIDDWWVSGVLGYQPPFKMYNSAGNFINGVEPPKEKVKAYYQDRRDFKARNPKLPIELVNCCSGDYPMWILAVPSSCRSAGRGYPEAFHPSELSVSDDEVAALEEFCDNYDIERDAPNWWLSSYWG